MSRTCTLPAQQDWHHTRNHRWHPPRHFSAPELRAQDFKHERRIVNLIKMLCSETDPKTQHAEYGVDKCLCCLSTLTGQGGAGRTEDMLTLDSIAGRSADLRAVRDMINNAVDALLLKSGDQVLWAWVRMCVPCIHFFVSCSRRMECVSIATNLGL